MTYGEQGGEAPERMLAERRRAIGLITPEDVRNRDVYDGLYSQMAYLDFDKEDLLLDLHRWGRRELFEKYGEEKTKRFLALLMQQEELIFTAVKERVRTRGVPVRLRSRAELEEEEKKSGYRDPDLHPLETEYSHCEYVRNLRAQEIREEKKPPYSLWEDPHYKNLFGQLQEKFNDVQRRARGWRDETLGGTHQLIEHLTRLRRFIKAPQAMEYEPRMRDIVRELIAAEYKIHVMPSPRMMPYVLRVLVDLLYEDEEFALALRQFKFASAPLQLHSAIQREEHDQAQENDCEFPCVGGACIQKGGDDRPYYYVRRVRPIVVLYPMLGRANAQKVADVLTETFGEKTEEIFDPQLGLVPSFNRPIPSKPFIHVAQGSGEHKESYLTSFVNNAWTRVEGTVAERRAVGQERIKLMKAAIRAEGIFDDDLAYAQGAQKLT